MVQLTIFLMQKILSAKIWGGGQMGVGSFEGDIIIIERELCTN